MSDFLVNRPAPLATSNEEMLSSGERIAEEALDAAALTTQMRREAADLSSKFDGLLAECVASASTGLWAHLLALLSGRPLPEEESITSLIEADQTLHDIRDQVIELTTAHRVLSERLMTLSAILGHLRFSLPLTVKEAPESAAWRRWRGLEASWRRLSDTRRGIEEEGRHIPLLLGSFDLSRWRERMACTYRTIYAKAYLPLETMPRFEDLRERRIAVT